jgi:hypothetical protein
MGDQPIASLTRGFSLVVNRPEREADHSPPSSAEVKNALRYTSTPPYVFLAECLAKHGKFLVNEPNSVCRSS